MPFADELLGSTQVSSLATVLATAQPTANWDAVGAHSDNLAELALSERARVIGAEVAEVAGSLPELAGIIERASVDPAFTGWMIWPMTEAVAELAVAGGSTDDLDLGLDLMAALTPRLTAEFSIRHLLLADLDRALAAAHRWARDPDEHVRRLASEGTRPHLPWARAVPAITAEPSKTIPILDVLYRDPSETVRRSVANHLNDISRTRPDVVVATAARWSAQPDPNTPALVRHALRTLVKRADPDALALLGFGSPDALTVIGPILERSSLQVGDDLAFELTVTNDADESCRVAVDFVVHFRKANGSLAPKVFKLATVTLAPGEKRSFRKSHSLRAITTRRYHAGTQELELQVNGARHGRVAFDLADVP